MGEFRLNEQQMKDQLTNLSNTKYSLYLIRAKVDSNILLLRLTNNSSTANAVRSRLGAVGNRLGKEIGNINKIKNTGNQICSYAKNAEIKAERSLTGVSDMMLLPPFRFLMNHFGDVTIGKVVVPIFAELIIAGFGLEGYTGGKTNPDYKPIYGDPNKGEYGGNQGAPLDDKAHFSDYADIVRKYYPDMSDKEVKNYLKKLNSEGCGYVAMVNTIFAQYAGREDEFEKTFGFPMYDKDGKPNSNKLLVDYYSAKDNHNKGSDGKDYINNNEDDSDTEGYGTTRSQREYRWESYLKDHGVDADVRDVNMVTKDNYADLAKNGEIVVAVRPLNLRDANGNIVDDRNGGHAMTVTGVTEDGMLKVSSWGKEYYINPNDPAYTSNDGFLEFQQVVYK